MLNVLCKDRKKLVEVTEVELLGDELYGVTVQGKDIKLAEYSTRDRAKQVFETVLTYMVDKRYTELSDRVRESTESANFVYFEMPKE